MAVSSFDLQNLECSLCYELLDNPRALPCNHLFCGPGRNCITSLKNGDNQAVVCPICRKEHHIDIDKLQPIYALNSFLETCKSSSQEKLNFSSATEAKPSKEKDTVSTCDVHQGQDMKYFCEDCKHRTCELCWTSKHESHQVVLLKMKLKKDISNAISNANMDYQISVCNKILESNKRLEQSVLEIHEEIDKSNKLLTERKAMLQQLDSKCKEFLNDPQDEKTLQELLKKLNNNSNVTQTTSLDKKVHKKVNKFIETWHCDKKPSNRNDKGNTKTMKQAACADASSIGPSSDNVNQAAVRKKNKSRRSNKNAAANVEQDLKERPSSSSAVVVPRVSSVAGVLAGGDASRGIGILFNYDESSEESDDDSDSSVDSHTSGAHSVTSTNTAPPSTNSRRNEKPANFHNRRNPKNPAAAGPHVSNRPQGKLLWNVPPPLVPDRIVSVSGIIAFMSGNILNNTCSILHTISEDLSFGKGFAFLMAKKFPPIPGLCRQRNLTLGKVNHFVDKRVQPFRFIWSMVVGKNDVSSLENGLQEVLKDCKLQNIKRICMPRIGCIDGGEFLWISVEGVLRSVFNGQGIEIMVYV